MHTTPQALAFDLHDRLHKSLRLSGKSATTLAADLGVHRNTINNYLSGKTAIDRRTLIAWALVTNVPLQWLEHGIVVSDPDPGDGEEVPDDDASDAVAKLAARKRRHGRRTTDRYQPSDAAA